MYPRQTFPFPPFTSLFSHKKKTKNRQGSVIYQSLLFYTNNSYYYQYSVRYVFTLF
nr:MAG TPA: hypothetical protein [Caudoviricetes sp.]